MSGLGQLPAQLAGNFFFFFKRRNSDISEVNNNLKKENLTVFCIFYSADPNVGLIRKVFSITTGAKNVTLSGKIDPPFANHLSRAKRTGQGHQNLFYKITGWDTRVQHTLVQ